MITKDMRELWGWRNINMTPPNNHSAQPLYWSQFQSLSPNQSLTLDSRFVRSFPRSVRATPWLRLGSSLTSLIYMLTKTSTEFQTSMCSQTIDPLICHKATVHVEAPLSLEGDTFPFCPCFTFYNCKTKNWPKQATFPFVALISAAGKYDFIYFHQNQKNCWNLRCWVTWVLHSEWKESCT